jgi:hypothetical protein
MIIWWSKHVGVILIILVCDIWINVLLQTSALVGPLFIMFIGTSWLYSRSRTWSLYLLYIVVISQVQVKLLFMWIIQGLTIDLTQNFRAWVARLHRTTAKQLGFSSGNFMVPCFVCHTCQIGYRLLQNWIYTYIQFLMSYTHSAAHSFLTALRVFTVVTLTLLAAVSTINIMTFMVICLQFQNQRTYVVCVYSQKWKIDPKGPGFWAKSVLTLCVGIWCHVL